MKRGALIIYCDKTQSGSLSGPPKDNINLVKFLKSRLGGEWLQEEIESLNNPTVSLVEDAINNLSNCDYTFIVFSGHGCVNTRHQNLQYAELSDDLISVLKLKTGAPRQTVIFDSCRGFENFFSSELIKSMNENLKMFSAKPSTRRLFDQAVLQAEEGWSILYAARENQSAGDSEEGGYYILSLLEVAKEWGKKENEFNVLPINSAHIRAKKYMEDNLPTNQEPMLNLEKRKKYFPFAVKLKRLL